MLYGIIYQNFLNRFTCKSMSWILQSTETLFESNKKALPTPFNSMTTGNQKTLQLNQKHTKNVEESKTFPRHSIDPGFPGLNWALPHGVESTKSNRDVAWLVNFCLHLREKKIVCFQAQKYFGYCKLVFNSKPWYSGLVTNIKNS